MGRPLGARLMCLPGCRRGQAPSATAGGSGFSPVLGGFRPNPTPKKSSEIQESLLLAKARKTEHGVTMILLAKEPHMTGRKIKSVQNRV